MTRVVVCTTALALVAFAGCAESNAKIETPAFDTRRADPELIRSAETALREAPEPDDGWTVGVVLAERGDDRYDWEASVLTHDGPVPLDLAINCHDGDRIDEAQISLLVDPGDLITWSAVGDDTRVCSAELRVLRKAAA